MLLHRIDRPVASFHSGQHLAGMWITLPPYPTTHSAVIAKLNPQSKFSSYLAEELLLAVQSLVDFLAPSSQPWPIIIPRLWMKNILHYLMLPGTIQTSTNEVVIIGNLSFQVDFLEPTLLLQDGPCKCTDRRVSKCKCFSLQRSRQSPARDEAPANLRASTNAKETMKLGHKMAQGIPVLYLSRNYSRMLFMGKFTVQQGKRLLAVSSKRHFLISCTSFCGDLDA